MYNVASVLKSLLDNKKPGTDKKDIDHRLCFASWDGHI